MLALTLPLRIAVLRAAAVSIGFTSPPLHCLLGFAHRFRRVARVATDDGQAYRQCGRCGLEDPHLGTNRGSWASGLQLGWLTNY